MRISPAAAMLGAALSCLAPLAAAEAQTVHLPFGGAERYTGRTALGCAIEIGKVIAVTNTTSITISAGTAITVDVTRYNGVHASLVLHGGALAPGAVIRDGYDASTSCTASYERPMLLQP